MADCCSNALYDAFLYAPRGGYYGGLGGGLFGPGPWPFAGAAALAATAGALNGYGPGYGYGYGRGCCNNLASFVAPVAPFAYGFPIGAYPYAAPLVPGPAVVAGPAVAGAAVAGAAVAGGPGIAVAPAGPFGFPVPVAVGR